jgi:hypothetical protein
VRWYYVLGVDMVMVMSDMRGDGKMGKGLFLKKKK